MTIQEQLVQLNSKFENMHKDFVKLDRDKSNYMSIHTKELASIHEKWNCEKDKMQALLDDVMKYYRIAKDNSNKELVRFGIVPQKPDFAKINAMLERVNEFNRNDYIAGQIIDLISSYFVYLNNEIARIDSLEQKEIVDTQRKQDGVLKKISHQKKQILASCESYIYGEEVRNLVKLFETIHKEYEINSSYFTSWSQNIKKKRMMLFGYKQFHLDAPQILLNSLKEGLKHHFDEKYRTVNCPCGYTTDTHEEIYVEYVEANESLLKQGIQALLLNYFRYFRADEFRISVLDYVYFNANILGPLSVLGNVKNGTIEEIPGDMKNMKQYISILSSYYHKLERKLGVQTVFEYNKTHKAEERIPYRILIINKIQQSFQHSDEFELQFLRHNAEKFGIILIDLKKCNEGGSKGTKKESQFLQKTKDYVHIISDSQGGFYIENNHDWIPFEWLRSVNALPSEFVNMLATTMRPVEKGTKYFNRYKPQLPKRSEGKRKEIIIPFAVDENDKVISCSFENELFAAYMMGASRSGKSTLLHTMISGLVMNYHPDELELWLLDFKMLEFKKYAVHRPPHVKYLLLEKSEDLVFDILDQMTRILDERQYIFSQNGWNKISEVPSDVYMPVIFVIIDEFAQMSQILKETKGMGYGADYTIKLENLLAKGAALGFKFIFASQTYTTGVSGLTDTACKQIQLRFALKNTPDEIKQTLTLSSDEITHELTSHISSLPPYETLYKWRNEDGRVHVGRFRNMYTEGGEVDRLVDMIAANMNAIDKKGSKTASSYYDKAPVLIDGSQPKTFRSQISIYKAYEASADRDDYDPDDVCMYPGVPCSFNLARPFILSTGTAQNILLVGGERESQMSVFLSLMNSYSKTQNSIEIWTHPRNSVYRKYKSTYFSKYKIVTDLDVICEKVQNLKDCMIDRQYENKLIVVFGYDMLANDLEILGADSQKVRKEPKPEVENSKGPDMSEILAIASRASSDEERRRLIAEYNSQANAGTSMSNNPSKDDFIYDAREDLKWIIKRASNYGIHFMFCFEQAKDFIGTRIEPKYFQHKLLFAMSKDDSISVMGVRKANEIEEGICVYSDGKQTYTMRPHIYQGIPNRGWQIDDTGKIVQRR